MSDDAEPPRRLALGGLAVEVHADRLAAGRAAAALIATQLRTVLARAEHVRVVFAAAPSQDATLDALAAAPGIDWARVVAFQMDEYRGLPADSPQLFAGYLRRQLFDRVNPGQVLMLDGQASPEQESRRYSALLTAAPLDLVCFGIGENGHLAFNDPGVADFRDPQTVRLVTLDVRSRIQQVNDGCFATLADVPPTALTMTVPALLSAALLVGSVPGTSKAAAVADTIVGPVGESVPATALRTHPRAHLFLDRAAASQLPA